MRSLVQSQRRLGAIVCALMAVVLGGIALLGVVAPWLSRDVVFGVPVPWLVLAICVYPVLIALAVYTVRHAERNERAFTDLVGRPQSGSDRSDDA